MRPGGGSPARPSQTPGSGSCSTSWRRVRMSGGGGCSLASQVGPKPVRRESVPVSGRPHRRHRTRRRPGAGSLPGSGSAPDPGSDSADSTAPSSQSAGLSRKPARLPNRGRPPGAGACGTPDDRRGRGARAVAGQEGFHAPDTFEEDALEEAVGAGGHGRGARAVPDATPAQRAARGKTARRTTPRSAHAEYVPAPDRPDRWASWGRSRRPGCPSSCRSGTRG